MTEMDAGTSRPSRQLFKAGYVTYDAYGGFASTGAGRLMLIAKLGKAYHAAVHAASTSLIRGEKEAQLTTPISNLLIGLSEAAKFGALRLIRETRLHRTRPDFAAVLTRNGNTRQKGFIELKAPSVSVNAWSWSGRNRRQWANMHREAGVLIVSNGVQAQLYRDGVPIGEPASLPYAEFRHWDSDPLIQLLCCFFDLNPTPAATQDMPSHPAMPAPDPHRHCRWMLHEAAIF